MVTCGEDVEAIRYTTQGQIDRWVTPTHTWVTPTHTNESEIIMGTEVIFEETSLKPAQRDRAVGHALDAVLDRIKSDSQYHNKNFKIARYENRSSASGTASTLRGKYGEDASCDGFTFSVAADDDKAYEGQFVLLTSYDPSQIVAGHLEASRARYEASEKEKAARYKANQEKKAKAAAAAKTGGVAVGTDANPTPATSVAPVAPVAPQTKVGNTRKTATG